jgi:hypothetical protein
MIEIDETLWMALAKLEEQELLLRELARNARASDNPATVEEYSTKSNEIKKLAARLREVAQDPTLQPHTFAQ